MKKRTHHHHQMQLSLALDSEAGSEAGSVGAHAEVTPSPEDPPRPHEPPPVMPAAPAARVDLVDLSTSSAAAVASAAQLDAGQQSSIRTFDEDKAAADLWILARCQEASSSAGADKPARVNHTALSYRREALRFIIWLREVRGRDLASARLEDALAYRGFMADPQPASRWCGPKGAPVGSAGWRPYVTGLSPRSRRQAMVVLGSMFRFLQDQGYLHRNPFTGVSMPKGSAPRIDPGRSLSKAQLEHLVNHCNARSASPPQRQLAWSVRFLFATGLRLSELTGSSAHDLRLVEVEPGVGQVTSPDSADAGASTATPGPSDSWVLNVLGKGGKRRDVPVPSSLVDELTALMRERARGGSPALLVSWQRDRTGRWTSGQRLSAQAFHRQLKRMVAGAADSARASGQERVAEALERASAHWLRHTHGRAAVAAGVDIDVVGHGLGHASLATTTLYTRPELDRRIRQSTRMPLLAGPPSSPSRPVVSRSSPGDAS